MLDFLTEGLTLYFRKFSISVYLKSKDPHTGSSINQKHKVKKLKLKAKNQSVCVPTVPKPNRDG